jgi:hypothetical protein
MAEGIDPEFKPEYCKKQKQKQSVLMNSYIPVTQL